MFDPNKTKLLVRGLYDVQKLRIQLDLRAQRLVRDGLMAEDEAKNFFEIPFGFFTNAEKEMEKQMLSQIKEHPVYPWLKKDVKGCGPRISGLLIANIDPISRFDTVSKLWAYSGLHVIAGAAARRTTGQKANWNQELKTSLWKLASSFIKSENPYRTLYDQYKNRIYQRELNNGQTIWTNEGPLTPDRVNVPDEKRPAKPLWTAGRINNMALRYIAKQFLSDLYVHWRQLEGLPVRDPYPIAYLGHTTLRPAMYHDAP